MSNESKNTHQIFKRAKSWPWFTLAVIAMILMVIVIVRQRSTISTQSADIAHIQNVINDTVKYFRASDGSQKATISAFKLAKTRDLMRIKTKDSTIIRLQNLVKNYDKSIGQGAAVVFTANTTIKSTSKTTVLPGDTVIRKDTVFLFPTYVSSFSKGKWASGTTIANRDSTQVNFKTYNEYDAVIGDGNKGWFKTPKPFVDVITHSPYDSISRLRAINVSSLPAKRLGLGVSAGYGFNTLGKPTVYVGVGVNYNFINIK